MYKVINAFTDLTDNRHAYKAGDEFPRRGMKVTEERLEELSSAKNRRGIPLIEKVPEASDKPSKTVFKEEGGDIPIKEANKPKTGKSGASKPKRKVAKKNA